VIDAAKLQMRLGVAIDGDIGPATLTALFARFGAKPLMAAELGASANTAFRTFAILDRGLRLAHFMGQCAHESGGFRYMEELGGPSYFARYDGRVDLGNIHPGDGARFHGRGPIQLTGRANYAEYGKALELDLINHPEQVARPAIGLLIACRFWSVRKLNPLADADDLITITKRVNGGKNGIEDRRKLTEKAKALIL
jgi:putative chitinase